MEKRFKLIFPREHGAWAMFVAPLVTGIGASGTLSADVFLFALTAFGFFLLRFPLMLVIKSRIPDARASAFRWSALYAAPTFLAGAMLLLSTQLWILIGLGALGFGTLVIYLWLAMRRAEMTIAGEWIGIAGLALGAPGAYLVGTGALDATAMALYLLNALYFGGTVLYIKFKVREQPRLVPSAPGLWARLWLGRVSILYHATVLALVAIFAAMNWMPALVLIAFFLTMCKVIGGVLTKPARLSVRRLGFFEVGFTLVFLVIVLMAYR